MVIYPLNKKKFQLASVEDVEKKPTTVTDKTIAAKGFGDFVESLSRKGLDGSKKMVKVF